MAQELGERPVQLRGSRLARAALRLAGWRLHFDGLPAAQGVVVVYPHTSNWDFPVALLAKWAVGLPVTFWGKDTLFRVPLFGHWLRWLGGLPVARHTRQGAVGQMVDAMRAAREQGRFMWLALAPEGTLLVAESGINHHAELVRLSPCARTFLVGESLMRHDDVAAATRALLNG